MKRLIPFEKFEASGNDFIIFDFFEFESIDLEDSELIKRLCHRHFGIGADGLIALSKDSELDFTMKYFNSDGKPSSFCGNGSRASLLYMSFKHLKSEFGFRAQDGLHKGKVSGNYISVQMKDISGIENTDFGPYIDSGSPHLMIETEDPWSYDVNTEGMRLRNLFGSEGVNVNFVSCSANKIRIATYERGVEWETLACGTGVTASAFYYACKNQINGLQEFEIEAKGGDLYVQLNYNNLTANNIWLSGKANKVFSGFLEC
jgi:diaminopimelate epimerase